MPCYSPLHGYRSRLRNPTGKRSIVFNLSQGLRDLPVTLPCGQCIGCRLEHSRQWAIRATHEAKLRENNSFLTLTYAPENLPKYGSLVKEHPVLFIKKLREHLRRRKMGGFRFFGCGEYGETKNRPHYHVCLFGLDFKDKTPLTKIGDNILYKSKLLDEIWTHGHCSIGSVTFESAAYVARYVTKKIKGKNAFNHYNKFNPDTGEILEEKLPEYAFYSKSLGKEWLCKYKKDVYPDDFVLLRGKKLKPPKYYNAQYEKEFPSEYAVLKAKRKNIAETHKDDQTYERLRTRELIQYVKLDKLKRNMEND